MTEEHIQELRAWLRERPESSPEIARLVGVSLRTVTKARGRHPWWPQTRVLALIEAWRQRVEEVSDNDSEVA